MPMYDDFGNKFLSLPEQVNKNKKDIAALEDDIGGVEPAGVEGDVQFNGDEGLGADTQLHWDNENKRLGVGTNAPTEKLHVDGNGVIEGDLDVAGNLTISGTQTSVDTATLEVEDNIILINKGQTGTPLSTLKSGIEVERGDEPNYFFYFDESDDSFKIGKSTLQPVATREGSPTNKAIAVWNSTTKRFETTSGIYADLLTTFRSVSGLTPTSPKAQVVGTDLNSGYGIARFVNTAHSGNFFFAKSRGGAVGAYNAVQEHDAIGLFVFEGSDGTDFSPAASFGARVDGTASGNKVPGRLVFATTPIGVSAPVDRMFIKNDGKVGISVGDPSEMLDVLGNIKASGDVIAGGDSLVGGDSVVDGDSLVAGNVGIGTTSPSRTLDIRGSIRIGTGGSDSLIDMPENVWGDKWYFAGSGIKMSMEQSSTSWLTTYGGSTGLTKFRWSSTKTGGPGALGEGPILDLLTEGTALFYGDVGIGTTSPTEKLDVAGKVKATEFVGDLVGDVTGTASGNLPNDAEVDDLDDVDITTPDDGQVLMYDNATSSWKNKDRFKTVEVTITPAQWLGTTICDKVVTGVTATNLIWVSASPASRDVANEFDVFAAAQDTNEITFHAESIPTSDVTFNVVIGGE